MKVFKAYPPYNNAGKTNFPEAKNRSGVYIIYENKNLVYVGYSANNLYKTIYRHFQTWTDQPYKDQKALPPEIRVTYKTRMQKNKYTVRVIFCTRPQAEKLEKMLILKYQPRDNNYKYDQYRITFADSKALETYEATSLETEAPF